jgi:predicted RNA binding protein YcfA (HicA-like mRNA interferase family)
MSRLPRVDGKTVIAALEKAGFNVSRIRGSHHFLRHADGRGTVVPVHGSETIGPGLLTKIINDCDMTREEFERLL